VGRVFSDMISVSHFGQVHYFRWTTFQVLPDIGLPRTSEFFISSFSSMKKIQNDCSKVHKIFIYKEKTRTMTIVHPVSIFCNASLIY
jgi:hypothetical protein